MIGRSDKPSSAVNAYKPVHDPKSNERKMNRMKTKSIFLLTLALGVALTARAYNHKWTGAASDAWSNGQNWTNNFPNPTEFRAMRLFFPSMSGLS